MSGFRNVIFPERLIGLNRLPNSRNGNPRFSVQLATVTLRTEPDASVGFDIQNLRVDDTPEVLVTTNGRGNIIDIEPVG